MAVRAIERQSGSLATIAPANSVASAPTIPQTVQTAFGHRSRSAVFGPAIGIDRRVVVAEAGGAVDQQVPDSMRADMAEGDGRRAVSGRSSLGRRVVMGIAVTH
jgi:hypothetical protein